MAVSMLLLYMQAYTVIQMSEYSNVLCRYPELISLTYRLFYDSLRHPRLYSVEYYERWWMMN
jgi:hypothetical protein